MFDDYYHKLGKLPFMYGIDFDHEKLFHINCVHWSLLSSIKQYGFLCVWNY